MRAATHWRAAGLAVVWCVTALSQTPVLKVTPATLSYAYTVGDPKLPASQKLSIAGAKTGTNFTVLASGGPWLSVTPLSGTTPATLQVTANPTTLAVGNYTGAISITSGGTAPETVIVAVTLAVAAPPATLDISPNPITLTYVRGNTPPFPIGLGLSTSGQVLSYTATAGGGTWLSVTPKSGAVFPAFPTNLTVTVNPAGLVPGAYKGTITIAAPLASNKTTTVNVNLTVEPGRPLLSSIWPSRITQGAQATTVTLQGDNFFSGTTVKSGGTTLTSTLVGPNVMTAVIPATMLIAAGNLSLIANNPGTGGGDSAAQTFTVLSSIPAISSVVDAASLKTGAISPGEMLVLFGTALGPDALASFVVPPSGQRIATSLANTTVLFDSTPAPIIYASATQTAVLAPYDISSKSTVQVKVNSNTTLSNTVTLNVRPAGPSIFTLAGTGQGQAVAFNYDEATGLYTLNSDTAQTTRGSIIIFYATGTGLPSPARLDGELVSGIATSVPPNIFVQIGGSDSAILYAGGVVGLTASIWQFNVRVPQIPGSKQTPVKVIINGVESPDGVTISVK
ncbi:MAG: hypothetical protein U0Q16_31500 [Bryobacteraceae bacterium]